MSKPVDRRPEPEIIPPGAPLPGQAASFWMNADTRGAHYVYARRIGPLGATLLTLGIAAVAGLALLFLLGTAIIGLAAIGVLTVAGVIAGLLRGPPRPLR